MHYRFGPHQREHWLGWPEKHPSFRRSASRAGGEKGASYLASYAWKAMHAEVVDEES